MLVKYKCVRKNKAMNKSLISRAMRQLAKRRVEKERQNPESRRRRQEIVEKAGRASWNRLNEDERRARIEKMVAARQKRVAPKAIARADQTPGSSKHQKRKPK
jgi:hypothetical protein